MTPDQARAAIYTEFADQWAARTVLHREGELGFSEPAQGIPWARLSVRHTGGGQLTLGPLGGRKYRRRGLAIVQIFSPLASGMSVGATRAHEARAILEGRTVDGVCFDDGVIQELPLGEGERSYQTNVEIEFTYDEDK